MYTIGEIVSRIRTSAKINRPHTAISDRYIFSLVRKHAAWLIRRQDSSSRLMKMNSVFQTLDIDLVEVDKVTYPGMTSGVTVMRSKDKLPIMLQGYFGPLIRSITSIDGGYDFYPTYPETYERITKQKTFKYNTKKYYWFLDGYLYFPNIEWDVVRITAAFEEGITAINKDLSDNCLSKQERNYNVPEFLFGELESQVRNDLNIVSQVAVSQAQAEPKHV